MNLKGKRIAILAENQYQEMELWVPYYRMKEEGAEVKVVGAGGIRSYTSKHGYPVTVDVQADAVTAVEFDAVIVPGGYAPDMMRQHDAILPREVAGVIYFAVVVTAHMRCPGVGISDLADEQLGKGAAWALKQSWLDSALNSMFQKYLEISTKVRSAHN